MRYCTMCLAVAVVACGLMLVGCSGDSRGRSRQLYAASQLKQVSNGLLLFADRNGDLFPSNIMDVDGKPLMSWRVALLPVLEHGAIFEQLKLDEPWDSPHNAALLKQVDRRLFAADRNTPDGHADMLAVIGENFGFSPNVLADPAVIRSRSKTTPHYAGAVGISSVTDGMTSTAFVVEVDPANSVPWAKPEDYTFNPDQPTAGLGQAEDNFFQVVFGDARSKMVSKNESTETLRDVRSPRQYAL